MAQTFGHLYVTGDYWLAQTNVLAPGPVCAFTTTLRQMERPVPQFDPSFSNRSIQQP
jgi:hypothetical protein